MLWGKMNSLWYLITSKQRSRGSSEKTSFELLSEGKVVLIRQSSWTRALQNMGTACPKALWWEGNNPFPYVTNKINKSRKHEILRSKQVTETAQPYWLLRNLIFMLKMAERHQSFLATREKKKKWTRRNQEKMLVNQLQSNVGEKGRDLMSGG